MNFKMWNFILAQFNVSSVWYDIAVFVGTRLSLDAMKKRLYIVKAYTNQDVQEESPPFFKVCIKRPTA